MGMGGWIAVAVLSPFALGAITVLVHSTVRAVRYLMDLLTELGEDTSGHEPPDLTSTEMRKE